MVIQGPEERVEAVSSAAGSGRLGRRTGLQHHEHEEQVHAQVEEEDGGFVLLGLELQEDGQQPAVEAHARRGAFLAAPERADHVAERHVVGL
jgi:hypothetical protein